MTRYVVLVVDDDEDRWENMTDAEREVTWQADYRFGQLLEERGGTIVGGEGLAHSRHGRTLTRGGAVTDGPYTESTEQIGGFFIVECDSYDDLTEAVGLMVEAHHHVEIRPVPERTS